jgi:hypothetical protein
MTAQEGYAAGLYPLWDGPRIVAWATRREYDRNLVLRLERVRGRRAALRQVAERNRWLRAMKARADA